MILFSKEQSTNYSMFDIQEKNSQAWIRVPEFLATDSDPGSIPCATRFSEK
jgi:hypothetical protein